MWPFKRTKWEKLGNPWTAFGVRESAAALNPQYTFLRDKDYRGIPAPDFERIILDCWFPKDYKDFTPEIWDCDNYAVAFMAAVQKRWAKISRGKEALAFGYIEAELPGRGWHAFNWHMDDRGVIRFYEPQSGQRVDCKLLTVRLVEA